MDTVGPGRSKCCSKQRGVASYVCIERREKQRQRQQQQLYSMTAVGGGEAEQTEAWYTRPRKTGGDELGRNVVVVRRSTHREHRVPSTWVDDGLDPRLAREQAK